MQPKEAEEHLRVIRSLMEKATIYRAISAPTAMISGLASVVFGLTLYFWWRPLPRGKEEALFEWMFIIGWGVVLIIAGMANTWLLLRDARRRNERFISTGMRHALLAMLPAMLCGAGLTAFFLWAGRTYWLPPMWMLCYALALLATKGFSPRSIPILGWAFFVGGFAVAAGLRYVAMCDWCGDGETHLPTVANLAMVATFGLFHLIYAACTWPRGAAKADAN